MGDKETFSEHYGCLPYELNQEQEIILANKNENWLGFTKTELLIIRICDKIKQWVEKRWSKRIYGE